MTIDRLIATICLTLFIATAAYAAPDRTGAVIRGTVTAEENGEPVEYAIVSISPSGTYTSTNARGEYEFRNVDAGKSTITVQFVGKETVTRECDIAAGSENRFDFQLKETSFRLEALTVVATQSKSGSSTASEISRQAMDHMQTSSLSDLMGFLPGVALSNSDLSSSKQFNIRTAFDGTGGGTAYGKAMNGLGTSIIVDGAPVSANANLQALAPSVNGDLGSTQSGFDSRAISTDNIESVEVIRGIPSAEYGDLTSGAVIVHSKAGREPVRLRIKANPNTYQAAATGGFKLGENAGVLNLSADYAYNTASIYESYFTFQRLGLKTIWSKTFADFLNTTTSLDFGLDKDTRKENPDDMFNRMADNGNQQSIRFNTNGTLSLNKDWLKSLKYTVSASYTDKYTYSQQFLSGKPDFYSTALTEGAIISSIAGTDVYDQDGRKITDIPAAEMDKTMKILDNYLSKYEIFGKEINVYAQLKADFNKKWGNINNHLLLGADFKTDGNLGEGKVYDDDTPPGQSGYEQFSSYRKRPYYEIPFVNQLGVFAEDTYRHMLGGKNELNVKLGARYDNVNGKSVISPRLNASVDIIPDVLTLRGGWGQNAKAPTVMYLYPERAYFNIGNYNGGNGILIGTVRSFDTENKDLEIATLRRAEIGVDLKLSGRYRLSITGFDDRMDNGYGFGRTISSYHLVSYDRYIPVSGVSDNIVPKFENTYNIFLAHSTPLNCIKSYNRGIEYELDLGRFDAIRTSFYINGAYIQSRYSDKGLTISKDRNSTQIERDLIVYDGGRYTNAKDKFLTTFRITHNIPELGFVITLVSQVNWLEKYWLESNVEDDTRISQWISHIDGVVRDYDYSLVDTPEYRYLGGNTFNSNRFIGEEYFPTVFFNINISKEIGDIFTASFFANNFINNRPLYKSKAQPGTYFSLLSDNALFFGFDLKFTIK